MSTLKQKIKSEMTAAMKAKEAAKLQNIRLIWNAIRKKEIDQKIESLSDKDVEKTLMTMKKQVQESLSQAEGAGRTESVEELKAEIALLGSFLPEQLSAEEIKAKVTEIVENLKANSELPEGPAAMGRVMKEAMAVFGSSADGKSVQQAVREAIA